MRKSSYIIILISILFVFPVFSFADQLIRKELSIKSLPVQSGGRVKPFDTFARESLRFIYGKTKFHKQPAVDILMFWMLLPEYWNEVDFVQVRESVLRETLKLDKDKTLFSPNTLLKNKVFIQEIAELRGRQKNKEPLDDYFKALQKLENRLILYKAFQRGEIPGWVPAVPKSKKFEQEENQGAKLSDTGDKGSDFIDEEAGDKNTIETLGDTGDKGSGFIDEEARDKNTIETLSDTGDKGGDQWEQVDDTGGRTWRALLKLKDSEKEYQLFQNIIKAYVTMISAQGKLISVKDTVSAQDKTSSEQDKVSVKDKASSEQDKVSAQDKASSEQDKVSAQDKTSSAKGKISDKDLSSGFKNFNLKPAKETLETKIFNFKQYLILKYPEYKKSMSKTSIELHYNQLNPFRYAWVFYLLGFLLLFSHFLFQKKVFFYSTLIVWAGGFVLQGYGMVLRSFIMGRPPVTNMYETVIWVPWVTVILGAFLWFRHKVFSVFACASAVALFCLLLADSAPDLLDGRLEPLEAVLRSNFWLATHVLVITMSYSAFFLAFALSDVLLFIFLRKGTKDQDKIRMFAKCIDRSLQVGVVLLAGGTILGGIWADYSWGRFWGWDPKETWALISLLGYLVLLHGRLVGWIKEFGLAVGSVLVFFLIVMAWYGVNYILGQGLHSYGFGSGGVEYVAGFALLHLIYVLLVWTLRPSDKIKL